DLLVGSDHLVHLTHRAAAGVGELVPGGRLPPGTVIPTCVDLDRFRPADDSRARRRELGLPPGPLVVHTGTLSGWYLGSQTVRVGGAVARLTGGAFLVLTRERDLAERLLAAEGVEALVRTAQPEDVPRWLGAADAGLALVRTGFAKSASAPTKVGEYLACGLAVAATAVGDLREQLDGGAAFTVADDAEPEEVARRLAAAAARPDRIREARALAATHFSLEEGVARYADIYRSLGVRPCA
ncbi:MAG: glycosyltransferase, partial [Gemmatimonadetes bacterium]|nr:glycosyltransferase [Gemmatimonadota bacterium]